MIPSPFLHEIAHLFPQVHRQGQISTPILPPKSCVYRLCLPLCGNSQRSQPGRPSLPEPFSGIISESQVLTLSFHPVIHGVRLARKEADVLDKTRYLSLCIASPMVLLMALLSPFSVARAQESADTAQPQAPAQGLQTFEDLVEVSEVFLDVLALREGEVARGLGIDDFVVEEDGEPVELTSVSYYTTRYGAEFAGATATEAEEVPSSRYFILFFHDQTRFGLFNNRLMRQQLRAARDARRWIQEAMEPSDWVAIVSYDVELRVHQDFTQDPEVLSAALERVATGKKPDQFRPGRREALGRGRELGILSRLPVGRELEDSVSNVYEGIQRVAETTGFLVGRKVMLLYTLGFGVEKAGGRASIPDPRYYPQLEPVLNDHNVAVYPIDLTPPGSPPPQEDFLQKLADDTGGRFDPNFTGFFQPFEAIAGENHGYYLLTYRSERPSGEIGYQNLTVTTTDQEIEVRARTGYRYGL